MSQKILNQLSKYLIKEKSNVEWVIIVLAFIGVISIVYFLWWAILLLIAIYLIYKYKKGDDKHV